MNRSPTQLVARLRAAVRAASRSAIRASRDAGRAADRRGRVRRRCASALGRQRRSGSRRSRAASTSGRRSSRSTRRRAWSCRKPSRRSSMCCAIASSTRRSRSTMRSLRDLVSSIFTNDLKRGRAVPVRGGVRLRHRQRQHRPVGRGDRRRVRRREGNRRRARKRLGQLARLYAALDQHDQLRRRPAASAGNPVRRRAHDEQLGLRRRSDSCQRSRNSSSQGISSSGSSGWATK